KLEPETLPNNYMQYYYFPQYEVANADPKHTRTDEIREHRQKIVFGECERIVKVGTAKNNIWDISGLHSEYIVDICHAIAFNSHEKFLANCANNGAISNMDLDSIVEVPALFVADVIQPIAKCKAGRFQRGWMMENNICDIAVLHYEYIVDICHAIAFNTHEKFLANCANNGAISNMDTDSIVEVPALFGADGIQPMATGKAGRFQRGLMMEQQTCEK